MGTKTIHVCDMCGERLVDRQRNYLSENVADYSSVFVCNVCLSALDKLLRKFGIELERDEYITAARVYVMKFKKQPCTPPNNEEETLACYRCGGTANLQLVALHNGKGHISGWTCACKGCQVAF